MIDKTEAEWRAAVQVGDRVMMGPNRNRWDRPSVERWEMGTVISVSAQRFVVRGSWGKSVFVKKDGTPYGAGDRYQTGVWRATPDRLRLQAAATLHVQLCRELNRMARSAETDWQPTQDQIAVATRGALELAKAIGGDQLDATTKALVQALEALEGITDDD